MKHKKIKQNSIKITGLTVKLTKFHSDNYQIIREVWEKFNYRLYKIRNNQSHSDWIKYGITYKENNEYYYLASISQNDLILIPEDYIIKEIPAGEYICFTHNGSMYKIKNTINQIYKKIIPENNINIESPETTGLIHFEKYDKRFNWNNPGSEIEIIIPLK